MTKPAASTAAAPATPSAAAPGAAVHSTAASSGAVSSAAASSGAVSSAAAPSLLEAATQRPLNAAEVAREQAQYAAQFVQLDREAWYTLGAAVITTVLFWGAIALTHDSLITVGYLPLWFALSCLGGYLFSVLIVVVLVKWLLRPCRLQVASYQELHAQSQPADRSVGQPAGQPENHTEKR